MVLPVAVKDALNKSNDWSASKNKLGDLVHQTVNCIKGNWKFSRDGGAVGSISLKDQDGLSTFSIPANAVIVNAFLVVRAAVTSGGALTLGLQAEAANDLLSAQAVAGLTLNAKIQGIPVSGTLSSAVLVTAARVPSLLFSAAAATAGEFDVYIFYV